MPSSLEIAQTAILRPIEEIAAAAGLEPHEVEPYGRTKAKIDPLSSTGSRQPRTESSSA